MASSFISRFIFSALPIALATLFVGCNTEIAVQRDPNLLTAGEYKITGITSYTINGLVSSTPISGTLSVYSGDSMNLFYIIEKTSDYQRGYLATQLGTTLKLESVYDNNSYGYLSYYAKQSGGGLFSLGRIEIDRYVNTTSSTYTSPNGERSTYTMPINKHVHFIATK